MPYGVDTFKYYLVRTSNSLSDLKKWISWARKNGYKQKIIIRDTLKHTPKEYINDHKTMIKQGREWRYHAYASYD